MNEQISIWDVVTPVPPMWDCRKTCKHFGEAVDYPSWWFGEGRCLLADNKSMKSILFDNCWFCYCTRYEEKTNE